jgi:diaminopimelate decarboxylase
MGNGSLTIFVSGLYSGTNPQPGVGISRSLRKGFPAAKLVGVEYSNRCSGVHWEDFDDIWLQRPWTEMDLSHHAAEIGKRLDAGSLWISSIDLEILWLGEAFPGGHANLLTPSASALSRVAKPAIPAHSGLAVRIPEFVTTELSDWELHAFCREHDWKVWLKGPYYEAVRIACWSDLEHWRKVLSKAWATEKLFLQSHVTGYEESYMLSAYRGRLLDCVHMRKRDVTELGKTWAGDAYPVEGPVRQKIAEIIRDLDWTGGAELEMVRDADDELWLLEWNPRFPAWVHGSTIAGHNLPAELVSGASGIDPVPAEAGVNEFTRVVIEVPVRPNFPLSPLPEPFGGGVGHSLKHPSGLLEFARKLRDDKDLNVVRPEEFHVRSRPPGIPDSYIADLDSIDLRSLQTPASLFFPKTAKGMFARTADLSSRRAQGPSVTHAYSIKTNPDERLLKLALEFGFLAEAISPLEARKAVLAGFRSDQIVLNGPAKWWRREELPDGKLHAVFCDSVEELEFVAAELTAGTLRAEFAGVRLRTPNIVSRFGVPVDRPELFERLITSIKTLPPSVRFGIHFHMASSSVGIGQWRHLFKSMLRWCSSIEALSGRVVECLDIGGGWCPDDIQADRGSVYREIREGVAEQLSSVTDIICEPGKALAQPTMALAMSVLEVRRYLGNSCEAVVDGSIAELPMYFFHPHRILAQGRGTDGWQPLERGDALLLGRLCMEHDIVASNIDLPDHVEAGDVLVFCDAGAYDRSMSYVFGCG